MQNFLVFLMFMDQLFGMFNDHGPQKLLSALEGMFISFYIVDNLPLFPLLIFHHWLFLTRIS